MPPKIQSPDHFIHIEPLTRSSFAPFGEVIQKDDALKHVTANQGTLL